MPQNSLRDNRTALLPAESRSLSFSRPRLVSEERTAQSRTTSTAARRHQGGSAQAIRVLDLDAQPDQLGDHVVEFVLRVAEVLTRAKRFSPAAVTATVVHAGIVSLLVSDVRFIDTSPPTRSFEAVITQVRTPCASTRDAPK
jgi:hypothetical protein